MKNIIFTITAFLLLASAALGQETVTTPKPVVQKPQQPGINVRVGQKFSVVTESKTSSISQVMGQEMETAITSNSTVIYEVIAVEPDSITLRGTISSLRIEAIGMGQESTFDSSRNDNSGQLADQLESEMRRVRTVTISRSGQIRKEDEPWANSVLSSQGSEKNKVGSVELFEPELTLPELKAGTVIPFTGNPPTSRSGSCTVDSINGGTANVSYRGKGQSTGVIEQMGTEMKMQSTWTERADLQIDAVSRVVLSRETTKDNTMVIKASEMEIPAKGKETISHKVTRLN